MPERPSTPFLYIIRSRGDDDVEMKTRARTNSRGDSQLPDPLTQPFHSIYTPGAKVYYLSDYRGVRQECQPSSSSPSLAYRRNNSITGLRVFNVSLPSIRWRCRRTMSGYRVQIIVSVPLSSPLALRNSKAGSVEGIRIIINAEDVNREEKIDEGKHGVV